MQGVHIVARDQAFAVGFAPGLLVSTWSERVTRERIAALDSTLPGVVAASANGKYVAITVVEVTASIRIDEDARALSTALQSRMQDHMRGHAYLVEGDGFLTATVRTLTAGLHLLTRSRYPLEVFKDPWPMASWVAQRGELDADEVMRVLGLIRFG